MAVVVAATLVLGTSAGARAASSAAPITYAYDPLGRLSAVIDPDAGAAKYNYDADGNVVSISRLPAASVAVVEFMPRLAAPGDQVAVFGTSFSATPSDDVVQFNGVTATIVSATTTKIVATVPSGATAGPITVTSPAGAATSTLSFAISGAQKPSLSSFTPTVGAAGTAVSLSGSNFSANRVNDVVAINRTRADVTAQTSTSLGITVPSGATSGALSVRTPDGTAKGGDFFVPPAGYAAPDVQATDRMAIGDTKTVTISTATKIGLVVFDGSAGQRVSLKLTSVTMGSNATIRIYDPYGNDLVPPFTAGTSGGFRDTMVLPQAGTYTILLDPSGSSTGSATLTLYNVPADPAPTITPGGSTVTVTTTVPGQNARPTFTGSAGQRVSLNVTNVTIGSGFITFQVSIVDAQGASVLSPLYMNTSPTNGGFVNPVTLPAAGTYTIIIDPSNANTGSATLQLYDVPADPSGSITPGGSSVTLTTTTPGQNGSLTFSGTSGQRVSLKLSNYNFSSGSNCGSLVSVKNPDGTNLYSATCPQPSINSGMFFDTKTLSATGTYTIVLDPQGTYTGTVTFTLYDVPADTSGSISIGGSGVTVSLNTPGQNGTLAFSGAASQAVRLSLSSVSIGTSTCCSVNVSIKKPDGTNLVSPRLFGTSGGSISTTLTVAGTYSILVDPDKANTGSATFTLTQGTLKLSRAVRGDVAQGKLGVGTTGEISAQKSTRRDDARPTPDHTALVPPIPAYASRYRSPYPTRWTPTPRNRRGNWKVDLPDPPTLDVPFRSAPRGVTALSGRVLAVNGKPLRGVNIELEDSPYTAKTDKAGRFLVKSTRAGHRVLIVSGAHHHYATFEIGVDLTRGRTSRLPYTIWLPKLDLAHARRLNKRGGTVIKTPRIPGLEVLIPAGATVTDDDGHAIKKLGITPVPVDRPPFPLPVGVQVPLYFTVQPGVTYVHHGGARIIYPNYRHLPPGTSVSFWNYDPDKKGWYVYGRGRVTADGARVVPDRGVKVWAFTGAMISGLPTPPGVGPTGHTGADPVDTGTGLFVMHHTDLSLRGLPPLALTRTYRPADSNSYSFGVGMKQDYDLTLWSVNNYNEADLILPDGGRIHYVRTSSGTGAIDAVYEAQTTPTRFYKSHITHVSTPVSGWNLTLRDGTVMFFPELSPLLWIRDRNGNQVTITRSAGLTGNITQVTSSDGRWIRFTYDASNRVIQAQDNSGRVVGYTYNANGRLATFTDAAGGVTTYTYDASGRMETIIDPRNVTVVDNDYDAADRVTQQTQADGSTWHFAYTLDVNGKISQTDITDPRGTDEQIDFNSSAYPLTERYAVGTPLEQLYVYERNSTTNLITRITDPRGRRTDFSYDANGNLTGITRLAGTSSAVTTHIAYDSSFGQPVSMTDPLDHTTTLGRDSHGNLISVENPAGEESVIKNNDSGQPVSVTDPLGQTTTFTYDLGDLIRVTDARGVVSNRFVDAVGRTASTTDSLGNLTRFEYDGLDNPATVTDSLGGQSAFSYDGDGNLTAFTNPRGKSTTFSYDDMNRLIGRTDPLDRAEQYTYDLDGNMSSFADRVGHLTTFKYDALDRQTFTGFGTAGTPEDPTYDSTIDFEYDNGNRLTETTDSDAGTFERTYDELDRRATESGPDGTVTYTYDDAGRRTSATLTGDTQISYSYDAADRLTTITKGSAQVALSYDGAGRRTQVSLPNGVTTDYSYDDGSGVSGLVYKHGATTLGDISYGRDALERPTDVYGSFARTNLPAAVSATYDDANELATWGSTSLTYNAGGQLISDGASTYTWSPRGELTGISGSDSATFSYDPFGRRMSKSLDGEETRYVYDGQNAVAELDAAGAITATLVSGLDPDEIFTRTAGASSRQVLRDALGSTVASTDAQGEVSTSYTYDPFGLTTSAGASDANGFQYTGRENDQTDLYYYRARYYSPIYDRFISEDPLAARPISASTQPTYVPSRLQRLATTPSRYSAESRPLGGGSAAQGLASPSFLGATVVDSPVFMSPCRVAGMPNSYAYVGDRPTYLVDPSGMSAACAEGRDICHALGIGACALFGLLPPPIGVELMITCDAIVFAFCEFLCH